MVLQDCPTARANFRFHDLESLFSSQRIFQSVSGAHQTDGDVVFGGTEDFCHFRVRKALEHQHDDLALSDGQGLNGRGEPGAIAGVQSTLLRIGPRISRVIGVCEFVERIMRWAATRGVAEAAIVSDAVNECALGTFAAKVRQRFPDGHGDLLHEFLPYASYDLVAEGEARYSRAVFGEYPLELLFQCWAIVGHSVFFVCKQVTQPNRRRVGLGTRDITKSPFALEAFVPHENGGCDSSGQRATRQSAGRRALRCWLPGRRYRR